MKNFSVKYFRRPNILQKYFNMKNFTFLHMSDDKYGRLGESLLHLWLSRHVWQAVVEVQTVYVNHRIVCCGC